MTFNVFITGATGYIGGQILYELLNSSSHSFNVTALVRSTEKAAKLQQATNNKVSTVIGNLDDCALMAEMVAKSDIIVNTANVDHVPSAKVLSDVLAQSTSRKILIHTSGTSVIGDALDAKKSPTTKVYSDSKNIDEINSLNQIQPHRPVDATVLDIHSRNNLVDTVIICPSTIYGVSNGFDNVLSIQVPTIMRLAAKKGQPFTVYTGDYIWSNIHIRDLGNLYMLILEKLIKKEDIPVNKQGYYFGSYFLENEVVTEKPSYIEHTWRDVAIAVGEKLKARNVIDNVEVAEMQEDEVVTLKNDEFAPYYWGTNSRSRGDNGKIIGWVPKFSGREEFSRAMDEEIDYLKLRKEL